MFPSQKASGWIEADLVHLTETPDGLLLICLDSLRSGTSRTPSNEES